MNKTIKKLIGKEVAVTLRAAVPTPFTGKLVECDETFLVLEESTGEMVIPLSSILHITAPTARAPKR
jgi:small nuclear ribonucleoprotein (snRNP)-like protein